MSLRPEIVDIWLLIGKVCPPILEAPMALGFVFGSMTHPE